VEAYCIKCRARREIKYPRPVTMKSGDSATRGICSTCGTKMFKVEKSR